MDILKGTARSFKIYMADIATPTAPLTGLVSFTVYLAKSGMTESEVFPTIAERGHGWYEVTPTAAHRDTLGESAWTFTATGAVDFPRKENVVLYDSRLVAVGANTTVPDNGTLQNLSDRATEARLAKLDRNLAAVGDAMTLDAAVRVVLASVQSDYAPAKAGDEMALPTATLTALFADADVADLMNQIVGKFDAAGDLPIQTIAAATRDAILDRIVAGNHDTAGTVGFLLQYLDALISSRQASGNVTVGSLTAAALALFATLDTGQSTPAAGSVAKLAQGADNVTVSDITPAALAKFAREDTGETSAANGSIARLAQGGGVGLTEQDISDISSSVVAGVNAVKPRIKDSIAGTYRLIAGDTWTQQFEIAAPAADRIIVAVKEVLTDSDDDAVILIDDVTGLLRLNKADATANATDGSITFDAATISVSLESEHTIAIPPARYYLIVKTLDNGDDRTWEYQAVLNVYQAGVAEVSAG